MTMPQKDAITRLLRDLEEIKKAPDAFVSATPLEDNMLEWHCNLRRNQFIFHLILFFPENYPYSPPSAEFITPGVHYRYMKTTDGRKGRRICCMDIFADSPWIQREYKLGWTPAYTVQSMLINVISFLDYKDAYLEAAEFTPYECPDCGHKHDQPFPPLEGDGFQDAGKGCTLPRNIDRPEIIDYISKETFKLQKPKSVDDLYGIGVILSTPDDSGKFSLTSPFEFLTAGSFNGMKEEVSVVHSVLKEHLTFFMPLFIHPDHGSGIKEEFEKCIKDMAQIIPSCMETPFPEMVIKILSNLANSLVTEFDKGALYRCDRTIDGYFILHRLLLWAVETYPDLQNLVESRLEKFIESPNSRNAQTCPDLEEFLFVSAASHKYRWKDIAHPFLSEIFKRDSMVYVRRYTRLASKEIEMKHRLKHTFTLTTDSQKWVAIRVCLLNIAMPKEMSYEEIIKKYDTHLGFSTKEMIKETRATFSEIDDQIESYRHWFTLLKLPVPTEGQLFAHLVESVTSAILSDDFPLERGRNGSGWRLRPNDLMTIQGYPRTRGLVGQKRKRNIND